MLKYARLKNMAVVYACLVVRSYFLSESEGDLAYAGVMLSRAMLCEILAMKLLSRFASNHIQLVAVLTTRWNPLAGATFEITEQVRQALGGDEDDPDSEQSAIEVCYHFFYIGLYSTPSDGHIYKRKGFPGLPSISESCE